MIIGDKGFVFWRSIRDSFSWLILLIFPSCELFSLSLTRVILKIFFLSIFASIRRENLKSNERNYERINRGGGFEITFVIFKIPLLSILSFDNKIVRCISQIKCVKIGGEGTSVWCKCRHFTMWKRGRMGSKAERSNQVNAYFPRVHSTLNYNPRNFVPHFDSISLWCWPNGVPRLLTRWISKIIQGFHLSPPFNSIQGIIIITESN